MILERVLKKLKERQQELALETMEIPAETLEKYHRMVGKFQGLGEAVELLLSELRDLDEQD